MRTRVRPHPDDHPHHRSSRRASSPAARPKLAGAALASALAGALIGASVPGPVEAATVTASYAVGHREVRINGYGAPGLGAFTLQGDPGDPSEGTLLALCLEADSSHTTRPGAYRRVANRVTSPPLDYLLWKYGVPGSAEHVELGDDHDTATAVAALAWFYADAQRRSGDPVWANPADGLTVLSPVGPHAWNALPAYTSGSPVGLRAGGVDLDAAERRVHDLFREAEARRGPWTMSPIEHSGGRAAVTVSGPAGPITGVGGVRFIVRDARNMAVANRVVTTDATGRAEVTVDQLGLDGGSIAASMYAPGVHEEWDGEPDVQRLSTGTSMRLDRRLVVRPSPRFVEVVKESSDDAFSPTGARFALLDAAGETISTATSGPNGHAQFGPVDLARHPGPHRVRELEAPDGLTPLGRDLPVPTPLSTDRRDPTTVEVTNDPERRHLRIRKVLDDDRLGPTDRSGFGFEVIRADGRSFGPATTDAHGRTPRLAVTRGRFEVCERSRPPWADVLADGGCVTVTIGAEAPATTEVSYTNVVPAPTISTRVQTGGAAHARIPAGGGTLVDLVSHTGLVPGTEYELVGEVLTLTDDGPAPTGLTGRVRFVAERADGQVAVPIEVPGDAAIDIGVVVQRLHLAGAPGAEAVAAHLDPSAATQTFWAPSITTAARVGSRGLVDTVTYRGLPPGTYTASVVWHERLAATDCRATDLGASTTFRIDEDEPHHGTVEIGPVPVGDAHAGRTLVAFQTLALDHEQHGDGGQHGDRDQHGDGDAPGENVVVADHVDCDADEQAVTIGPRATTTTTTTTTTTSPATTTTPPGTTSPAPTSAPTPSTTTPAPGTSSAPTIPSTTGTTPATSVVVEQESAAPLPAAGANGLRGHAGLALMALGAGGLVVVTAAQGRHPRR